MASARQTATHTTPPLPSPPLCRLFLQVAPPLSDEDRRVVDSVSKLVNFLSGGSAARALTGRLDPRALQVRMCRGSFGCTCRLCSCSHHCCKSCWPGAGQAMLGLQRARSVITTLASLCPSVCAGAGAAAAGRGHAGAARVVAPPGGPHHRPLDPGAVCVAMRAN